MLRRSILIDQPDSVLRNILPQAGEDDLSTMYAMLNLNLSLQTRHNDSRPGAANDFRESPSAIRRHLHRP